MNKISHSKSIIVSILCGFIASSISIIGGYIAWTWADYYVTEEFKNYAGDDELYLSVSIIFSITCYYLLARLLAKVSGRFFVIYSLPSIVFSFITLFFAREEGYPLFNNILVFFSMLVGLILGFWHYYHLTNKGIGRDTTAPML